MNKKHSNPIMDEQLLQPANESADTGNFLKWMYAGGVIGSIVLTSIWFFSEGRRAFLPGYFMVGWMIGWGIMLVILSMIFLPSLLFRKIMAEYDRFKNAGKPAACYPDYEDGE